MATPLLWKPVSSSDGKLVVLTPSTLTNRLNKVYIVTPDGKKIPSKFTGVANGKRAHYRFPLQGQQVPKGSQLVAETTDGNQVQWDVQNPGKRQEDLPTIKNNDPRFQIASKDAPGTKDATTVGDAGSTSAAVDETGGDFSTAFPSVDASGLSFNPIKPSFIPKIDVPVVDPIDRTGQVGDFNRGQDNLNFQSGKEKALALNELEFQSLQDFNRRARGLQQEGVTAENAFNPTQIQAGNQFNRGEFTRANQFNRGEITQANEFNQKLIGPANQFNQQQRLQQLETALPGARKAILNEINQGQTLSEGRLPNTLDDRAFEVAARNAAAEGSTVRGFGEDSAFGRKTSDLLSAQQRLQLSQAGAQQTDRFLTLGANLAFDQPIKFNPIISQPLVYQPQQFTPQQTRTAQDVRGAPSVPASTLAVGQQELLTPLTTIQPGQAIGFDVNQNQFQGSLTQRTNEFNSQLDFNAQQFNSSAALQVELEKLMANTFNAQQQAGAINQSSATGLAQGNFQSGIDAGQQASTIGAVGQVVGTIGSVLANSGLFKGAEGAVGAAGTVATPDVGGLAGTAAAAGSSAAGSIVPGAGTMLPAVSGGSEALSFTGAGGSVGGGAAVGTAEGGVPVGAGSVTPAALSSIMVPAGIAAVAALGGRGVYDTVKGIADGSISHADVRQGLASIGAPDNVVTEGANAIMGHPIGRQDLARAQLLSNPITAPFAIADMLGSDLGFGGGKPKAQQERDGLRGLGQDLGVFYKGAGHDGLEEKGVYMNLASGRTYNVGKDGGAKLKNYALNIDGKSERNTYDIDWSDPRASESVGLLNPVAFMLFGKNAGKMMGHMWNGVTSDNKTLSDTKANIQQIADDAGLDYHTGLQILKQYKQRDHLNDQTYMAMLNGWNDLMLAKGVRNEIVA